MIYIELYEVIKEAGPGWTWKVLKQDAPKDPIKILGTGTTAGILDATYAAQRVYLNESAREHRDWTEKNL